MGGAPGDVPDRRVRLREAGVNQQPPKARWLTFAGGPGGEALGPAPTSVGCLAKRDRPADGRCRSGRCVAPGAMITGPVTVKQGGLLFMDGATVTGPVKATGAELVRICGSRLTGPLTVDGQRRPRSSWAATREPARAQETRSPARCS